MEKPRIVYVEWVDAVAHSSWDTTQKLHVDVCETVGFLVAEEDEFIGVAAAISEDREEKDLKVNAVITIPKAWIRKKRYLKGPARS